MEKIDIRSFELAKKVYHKLIKANWLNLLPTVNESYKILKDKDHYFDIDKSKVENIKNDLFSDDHSIHAGILNENLCNKGKVLYIHNNETQFIVIFIEKEFETDGGVYNPGVIVFRVYEEIDINCIENSWNIKNTEKWITNLDLTRETFTDVTKYSQILGEGEIYCNRPTIKWILDDFNRSKFVNYAPIFDTCTGRIMESSINEIEFVMRSMILLGVRLGLKNVEI